MLFHVHWQVPHIGILTDGLHWLFVRYMAVCALQRGDRGIRQVFYLFSANHSHQHSI